MDRGYLANLGCGRAEAAVTSRLARAVPASVLPSVVLAVGAFGGTFTALCLLAHRRESLLLRYWMGQGRKALKRGSSGKRG
jgi:hypothetical protein